MKKGKVCTIEKYLYRYLQLNVAVRVAKDKDINK